MGPWCVGEGCVGERSVGAGSSPRVCWWRQRVPRAKDPSRSPSPPRPTRRPRRPRPPRSLRRPPRLLRSTPRRSGGPRTACPHHRRRPAERHLRPGLGERREPRLHAARSGDQGVRHPGGRTRPRHRRRQHRQRLRVARHRHRYDRGGRLRRRTGDYHRRVPGVHRRLERLPGRRRLRRPVGLVRR